MLERDFQSKVIKTIKERYPDSIVLKNDPNYIQGFPDLTIHNNGRYALLECKRSENEPHQPNQDYYISWANEHGGFGGFICPENMEELLKKLDKYIGVETYFIVDKKGE